jgi:inositol phosphorylceramide mannosyltransferase catalytic subunit
MIAPGAIPKRIIQTGKTRNLSLLERAAAANLTALNPGFEHLFFTDQAVEQFIDQEFPEYRDTFDRFPFAIQRFDFFRYLAVYKLGGFYFDLDVFLARSIADLAGSTCVFPFEELTLNSYLRSSHSIDWEIGNYAFAAAPAHPFLLAVIENCVRAQNDPAWLAPMMRGLPSLIRARFTVLNTTGPGLVTRTLVESPGTARGMTILFPDDVCDDGSWHKFGDYGVHLMSASWRGQGSYLARRLALMCEKRIRKKLLADSRKLGKVLVMPSGGMA